MTKSIRLYTVHNDRGYVAFIDDEDYGLVMSKGHWYLYPYRSPTYYTCTGGKGPVIQMHQLILPSPKGFHTCHLDGNGLNNRRTNLKIVSPMENMQYKRKYDNNTSGVPGVKRYAYRSGWWQAQITVYGKRKYLGIFSTFEAACKARQEAERCR